MNNNNNTKTFHLSIPNKPHKYKNTKFNYFDVIILVITDSNYFHDESSNYDLLLVLIVDLIRINFNN